MPYVLAGSGSDTLTESLALGLALRGHEALVRRFPHFTQFAPDLLRAGGSPEGCDLALTNSWNGFAFSQPGIPMVTVVHLCVHDPVLGSERTLTQAAFHRTLVRWFEKRSFDMADAIVVPSQHTQDAVRHVFGDLETLVIRQGVDVEFFHPHLEHKDEQRPFRLLFVGNLTRRKGADLLDPVMKELGPDFILHYTSGGRNEVELEASNAYPLGTLDRLGVRDAYQRADVLLCPTRLESGPLVAMEAMACGLPVVGSNVSSMPETVVDASSGLLRTPDPTALARAVVEIASDPSLRKRLSAGARQRAVDHFNIEVMVDRYMALFTDLVDSKSTS